MSEDSIVVFGLVAFAMAVFALPFWILRELDARRPPPSVDVHQIVAEARAALSIDAPMTSPWFLTLWRRRLFQRVWIWVLATFLLTSCLLIEALHREDWWLAIAALLQAIWLAPLLRAMSAAIAFSRRWLRLPPQLDIDTEPAVLLDLAMTVRGMVPTGMLAPRGLARMMRTIFQLAAIRTSSE